MTTMIVMTMILKLIILIIRIIIIITIIIIIIIMNRKFFFLNPKPSVEIQFASLIASYNILLLLLKFRSISSRTDNYSKYNYFGIYLFPAERIFVQHVKVTSLERHLRIIG